MVLSVVAMSTAFAGAAVADDHDVDASFGDVSADPGDTVMVPLDVESAQSEELNVTGYDITVQYDHDVLAFEDAHGEDGMDVFSTDDSGGEVQIMAVQQDARNPPETPATVTMLEFTVLGSDGDAGDVSWDEAATEIYADSGEHDVQYQAGTVSVGESSGSATFGVSDLEAPETAAQGDAVDVSATIENGGDAQGTQTIELLVDDAVEDAREVTLAADDSERVTFDLDTSGLEPDSYEVAVSSADDAAAGALEIEHSMITYASDDGVVETDGLRDAIDDWRSGDVDTDMLRDVIDHWRTGDPVA